MGLLSMSSTEALGTYRGGTGVKLKTPKDKQVKRGDSPDKRKRNPCRSGGGLFKHERTCVQRLNQHAHQDSTSACRMRHTSSKRPARRGRRAPPRSSRKKESRAPSLIERCRTPLLQRREGDGRNQLKRGRVGQAATHSRANGAAQCNVPPARRAISSSLRHNLVPSRPRAHVDLGTRSLIVSMLE